MVRSLLILNPYTPGPAALAERYEPWLRSEDNPTFNSVRGVGEYSNWKVISSPRGGWTHFDLFALENEDDLERVWFSPELERFRSKWVALWGYGAASASGHATLFAREGDAFRATSRYAELAFDAPQADWKATSVLRKHWALGAAREDEPWRRPIAELNPLGCSTLRLQLSQTVPSDTGACLAECIAAPTLT